MTKVKIILYKCPEDLIKLIVSGYPDAVLIKDDKGLLSINNKIKSGLFIHYGEKNSGIITNFNKINKDRSFTFLFLLPSLNPEKYNFKINKNDDILYFTIPRSKDELLNLISILLERQALKHQVKDCQAFVDAFDHLQDLSRKELVDARECLKAYEIFSEISHKELVTIDSIVKAWEKAAELSKTELKNKLDEIKAYDNVLEYTKSERIFLQNVIKAWENTMDLARKELLNAYKKEKDKKPKGSNQ